jgi:AcrR family transcriptional regulator
MVAETAVERNAKDEHLSAWQQRTLDRSLIDAKRRALTKSGRFVQAAIQLLWETGGLDFTVQDVVDRSKLSLRSFYQAFASKDDLLLALFEEYVASGACAQREAMAELPDPIDQIRTYLMSFWGGDANPDVTRALTLFHLTLASTRPNELAHALEPPLAVLLEAVERGVATGQIRSDVEPRRLSQILLHTSVAAVHTEVLRTYPSRGGSPDDVWAFCLDGLRAPA